MTLGIYGSGGLGREVLETIRAINAVSDTWQHIVFINDFKTDESLVNGIKVFTFDEFKAEFLPETTKTVIAVGEPQPRKMLREKVTASGYSLQTIIHPTAFIASETQIGDGTIVQFGSLVSCNVTIGESVAIHPNTNIGHDSVVGNDVVFSPFVALSGHCIVGDEVYLGVGAIVKERITIGKNTIIGMGSAVMRDIQEDVIALGNPARAMKKNEDGRVFK
ncbi:MAG: acetyltransferase [Oscillospiraceae bacterium]|nr:acetyltransferase [Oscillospiraceae bacterium]